MQKLGANDQDLDQLVALFNALANRTRLRILLELTAGERNVASLCHELGLPQPTVSHQLGMLLKKNLVGHKRAGKHVVYGLRGEVGAGSLMRLSVQNLVVNVAARFPASNSRITTPSPT